MILERVLGAIPGSRRLPELEPPSFELDDERARAFEAYTRTNVDAGGTPAYELAFPKHEYVRWLARSRPVLFHGSPGERVGLLEPRRATGVDAAGRQLGVYASPWPLWSMWFAVLNKRFPFVYTINGSRAKDATDFGERVYWFKVNPGARSTRILSEGHLYVLPRSAFEPCPDSRFGPRRWPDEPSQEWVSRQPIEPLCALPVSPADFPFLSAVTRT